MSLRDDLLRERLAIYGRLRGGYPIPLAGAVYWIAIGVLGFYLPPKQWTLWAFILSGSIFPLALLFAQIFGNKFMKDKSAVGDLLVPAFISMLLFWPLAFVAFGKYVEFVPLILAIGMSQHWPVIGWTYGRTALFSAHAIVRAVACTAIWIMVPADRFTFLPFCVALIYLLTVGALVVDSRRFQPRPL